MKCSHSRGQVAVYLMMSLVAVFLLALLTVDVFVSVRGKNTVQNGGDAAALAAAHRQGELINEIGRLNKEHIKAALLNDEKRCIDIGLAQRRLALIGPVKALGVASAAAKKNGIAPNECFSRILKNHADEVRHLYANGGGGAGDPLKESYPGAWDEYAGAIAGMASANLSVGADNIDYYYAYGSHLLLNPDFYSAIAAQDWCWFWFNDKSALDDYRSYNDWSPLTPIPGATTENSEIFSLHLVARTDPLTTYFSVGECMNIAGLRPADLGLEDGRLPPPGLLDKPGYTWFFFDNRHWGTPWFNGKRLANADENNDYEFPILGTIKDEYNVRGCAAVCRAYSESYSLSTDTKSELSWAAAAKPFGVLDKSLKNFVVPCMSDVRLVSVSSVDGGTSKTADPEWITHIRIHLPDYMNNGPKGNDGCWYCAQLKKWEKPSFHHTGTYWLKFHSGECVRSCDCNCLNCGPGGGIRHGH